MKTLVIGLCLTIFILAPGNLFAVREPSPYLPSNYQKYQQAVSSEKCCEYYDIARSKAIDYERRLIFIKERVEKLIKEEEKNLEKIRKELNNINKACNLQGN